MRIVICDDEKRICDILAKKVEAICPDAEIITYTSGEDVLNEDKESDIFLLDIKMPGISGIDVAKKLRKRDFRNIIIFITGEEDEVFNSFDVHAFHFLVKPVSDDKLKSVLEDAMRELGRQDRLNTNNKKYINVKSGASHIRIDLTKLMYAEVFDRKILLHMTKEDIEYYGQLSVLEKVVGKDFHRIHRSYLVNMKYINCYNRTSITLASGADVPISRRAYDGFLNAYMDYSLRRMV